MRALSQCDVGADEDHVAALAGHHAGKNRGGKAVGADEVDLDLGREILGVDLVKPAEEGVAGAGDQYLDGTEFLGCPPEEFPDRIRIRHIE